MIVPEHLAKQCLSAYGLRTPAGRLAATAEEVRNAAQQLGCVCVVKALAPIGGRGKAGGVKLCADPDEAVKAASAMFGMTIHGHIVDRVLVEEALPPQKEYYAAVMVNQDTGSVDVLLCLSGGMEIENLAATDSGAVLRLHTAPGRDLPLHEMRAWLTKAGVDQPEPLALCLTILLRASRDLDAMLLEINPLALLADGTPAVLDCKLEVDDSALYRQPALQMVRDTECTPLEQEAKRLGVSFVPLDGEIGVIASGAGLGMATLDMLRCKGLAPANFLDTGGGISVSMLEGAVAMLLRMPSVKGLIINLYGGINRMLDAAQGIAAALEKCGHERPVVTKILGNQQEEAWALLETLPNVHVCKDVQSEKAVARLASILGVAV
ncbi:MAG: acetate--CoA ligase family protein [Deltaproteobacteria bacterium]|jgi:succinyl-CoA synthetase beta subunit|nr:acetate--CoA ligase family protein [Deltaproteobacteria bacterium]